MGGPGSNSGGSRGSVVSSNESESALLDQRLYYWFMIVPRKRITKTKQ